MSDFQITSIAILGATSHIAKGLIQRFLREGQTRLTLFTRSAANVYSFLRQLDKLGSLACTVQRGYYELRAEKYDAIINCVGVPKGSQSYVDYFTLTETYDNLCLAYLDCYPEAAYLSFGSGAVYGDLEAPASDDSKLSLPVNQPALQQSYTIARLNSEAKHRALPSLRIVDLRLFGYFSRFYNPDDGYFMSDLMNALLRGQALHTSAADFYRDYIHPDDLFALVTTCLAAEQNFSVDAMSKQPVTKQAILNFFTSEYGLQYIVDDRLDVTPATGHKSIYYSQRAMLPGQSPTHTALEAVSSEAAFILKGK